MIEKRLRDLVDQLQGKKPHLPHFLSEIYMKGIRGIDDLRVKFDYPVSVIAGGNASGKSTILFAAACAYKVPEAGVKDFVPSTLFPDYYPRTGGRKDERHEVILQFDYSTPDGRMSMRWRRSKGWNRSFLGRKDAKQPERQIYLRTLSNLSNPSEVRGVLSMSRLVAEPNTTPLTASQIEFARQMLPFRYSEVVDLSSGNKKLLFASHESGTQYSELHMAAGERAILRLSQEIAQLEGALVLIDEVEAGLHPWIQQLLMLQLQQLALRRNLQVIVTSHSPAVLDSVPMNGRIFLDRSEEGKVTVIPSYRDFVQNALYGRSVDSLNLLCEDEAAEGILRGIFDVLLPEMKIRTESIRIGRDTGANEFPTHVKAFSKFGRISNFVLVLDGDQRDGEIERRIKQSASADVPVFYLPGNISPEPWVWDQVRMNSENMSNLLGISSEELLDKMNQIDAIYDSASDAASEIAKIKIYDLSKRISEDIINICRTVARLETNRRESEIQPLVDNLRDVLQQWRDT